MTVFQEGIDYLKAAGKDTLLEMQGLKDSEESTSKASVPRDSTMEATAKVICHLHQGRRNNKFYTCPGISNYTGHNEILLDNAQRTPIGPYFADTMHKLVKTLFIRHKLK